MEPHYESVAVTAKYAPWRVDPEFQAVYPRIRPHTLVEETRCWELWDLLPQAFTGGDILEVGVWRGGTGCLLAARARQLGLASKVYLCDTFSGVPKQKVSAETDPVYRGGEHADATPGDVLALAKAMALNNVEVVAGVFPESFAGRKGLFRFVHIDVDVYASAKEAFEFVLPAMSAQGIVVFDDYGFVNCGGVTRFVNELKASRHYRVIHNLNGHAIVL